MSDRTTIHRARNRPVSVTYDDTIQYPSNRVVQLNADPAPAPPAGSTPSGNMTLMGVG